jgi:hypothetical protein
MLHMTTWLFLIDSAKDQPVLLHDYQAGLWH